MSCVQLSEGGFQVVYPLGLLSRSSGLSKSYMDMASKLFTFTFLQLPCCKAECCADAPIQVVCRNRRHSY